MSGEERGSLLGSAQRHAHMDYRSWVELADRWCRRQSKDKVNARSLHGTNRQYKLWADWPVHEWSGGIDRLSAGLMMQMGFLKHIQFPHIYPGTLQNRREGIFRGNGTCKVSAPEHQQGSWSLDQHGTLSSLVRCSSAGVKQLSCGIIYFWQYIIRRDARRKGIH